MKCYWLQHFATAVLIGFLLASGTSENLREFAFALRGHPSVVIVQQCHPAFYCDARRDHAAQINN